MYKIADDLIKYEYDNKLALMNGRFLKPLIFSKGIDYIKNALIDPNLITDHDLLSLLIKYKIIIEGSELLPTIRQTFIEEGKKDFGLYLLVTQKCNFKCTYCLGANDSYLNNTHMNEDIAIASLEMAAKSMAPKGKIQFIYFGGEPLLNWKLIKFCIDYTNNNLSNKYDVKFKHHITTNLSFLPKDFIKIVKDNDISILVDIDGNCTTHNKMRPFRTGHPSYDQIIKNIEILSANSIYYEIRATITSDNVKDLRAIQHHHFNLKPAACAFPTLIPSDSEGHPIDTSLFPNPDVYRNELFNSTMDGLFDIYSLCPCNVITTRLLTEEFVSYGCGMVIGNTAVVTNDGSVYPCIYFVGQKKYYIGDIKSSENVLSQKHFKSFYNVYKDILNVDNISECKSCSIRYLCGGGCPVRLLNFNNNNESSKVAQKYFYDITCAGSWASVEASIRHFEEKAKQPITTI